MPCCRCRYEQYITYGGAVLQVFQMYRLVVLPVANTWMSWRCGEVRSRVWGCAKLEMDRRTGPGIVGCRCARCPLTTHIHPRPAPQPAEQAGHRALHARRRVHGAGGAGAHHRGRAGVFTLAAVVHYRLAMLLALLGCEAILGHLPQGLQVALALMLTLLLFSRFSLPRSLQMRFLLHAPLQLASVLFAASSTTEVCGRFFASNTSLGCMGAVSLMQLSLGVFIPGAPAVACCCCCCCRLLLPPAAAAAACCRPLIAGLCCPGH